MITTAPRDFSHAAQVARLRPSGGARRGGGGRVSVVGWARQASMGGSSTEVLPDDNAMQVSSKWM
jgi:hypothetical protein